MKVRAARAAVVAQERRQAILEHNVLYGYNRGVPPHRIARLLDLEQEEVYAIIQRHDEGPSPQ